MGIDRVKDPQTLLPILMPEHVAKRESIESGSKLKAAGC